MQINVLTLLDDSICYDLLRKVGCSDGVSCPHCLSISIRRMVTMKFIDINCRQKYECKDCQSGFADLTGTIFSGSNKSLKVWIVFLYLMSLNLSTGQISTELDISYRTAYRMTPRLQEGIVKKSLIATLAVQLKLTKFT